MINSLSAGLTNRLSVHKELVRGEADDAEFDEVLERVVAYTEDVEPDCEIIR